MTNNTSNRLGQEKILPLLFKLSIPAIISMFTQALYNVVDSIFVAKISEKALAAVSLAFPLQMIVISLGVGTGVGVTSLISRLLGQGDEEKAVKSAGNALILAIFYGFITIIAGLLFTDNIISLLSDDVQLVNLVVEYLTIIFAGSLFIYIPMIANNILRGEGNTFIPMITMLVGAILNIALDPLFIFGFGFFPALGVKGAAYATILSRVISGLFILTVLFKGNNQLKIRFKNIRVDLNIIKNIYGVGLPAIFMQLLNSVSMYGLNFVIAAYGTTAIAVLGIYFKLQSFVLMPVFGLGQGYMPIIGYNYGNSNIQRIKDTVKIGLISGVIITTIGFALFFSIPDKFIMLFRDDPELLSLGIEALRKISIAYPLMGIGIMGSITFQAIGKGASSLVLTLLRLIVLLLPVAILLNFLGGLKLIWFAFPVAEGIASILVFLWLKSTLKIVYKNIEEKGNDE